MFKSIQPIRHQHKEMDKCVEFFLFAFSAVQDALVTVQAISIVEKAFFISDC